MRKICDLCRRCSRGMSRNKLGIMDFPTRATKSANGGVHLVEIGNLLEDFKTDIFGTLSSQLDVFQAK